MHIEKPLATVATFCKHATLVDNRISITNTIDYLICSSPLPAKAPLFVALKFNFPRDYPESTLQITYRDSDYEVMKTDHLRIKPTQGKFGPAFGAIVFGAEFDITTEFHYLEVTLLEAEITLATLYLPIYLSN